MSDFHMSADFLRGQIADALSDNVEQAVWVFGALAAELHLDEIEEFIDNIDQDPKQVAQFYRDFAHLLDPDPNR